MKLREAKDLLQRHDIPITPMVPAPTVIAMAEALVSYERRLHNSRTEAYGLRRRVEDLTTELKWAERWAAVARALRGRRMQRAILGGAEREATHG